MCTYNCILQQNFQPCPSYCALPSVSLQYSSVSGLNSSLSTVSSVLHTSLYPLFLHPGRCIPSTRSIPYPLEIFNLIKGKVIHWGVGVCIWRGNQRQGSDHSQGEYSRKNRSNPRIEPRVSDWVQLSRVLRDVMQGVHPLHQK